jgi:Flp pilus assembly protein TadG
MLRPNGLDRAFGRLVRRSEGNITVLFALSLMALIVACGVAIDYGRYLTSKTALQAAVDAAALQVSARDSTDETEMKALAQTVLQDTYASMGFGEIGDTKLTIDKDTLTLSAEAQMPSTLMGLTGVSEMTLEGKTEISKSSTNLEVALVLDVSSSVSTMIAAVKENAISLAETVIENSDSSAETRVSVIPFDDAVNVGTYATAARGLITPGTCYTTGCEYFKGRNYYGSYTTFTWSNCVTERTGTYAYTDDPPSTSYVGHYYTTATKPRCPNVIVPLSDDLETIKSTISGLTFIGATAGQIGIAWGWYTLSPTFGIWSGDAVPDSYDSDTQKVMVILTDGDFNIQYCNEMYSVETTAGILYRTTCSANNGLANDQAAKLCTAIKAKGIAIYTIGYKLTSGSTMETFLSTCASGESYAFLPETTSELESVFKQIAEELTTVRVSQ